MENNLFRYATSELLQDAFICYFLSFASKKYKDRDSSLANCAQVFLKMCLPGINEFFEVTQIRQQYIHIDVLITVNEKYNIIIEDKTFTGQHGDQISRYQEQLSNQGYSNISCVYYKIVEQCYPEQNVINILRKDMLDILHNYTGSNNIIRDYIEYLEYIDSDENAYTSSPIIIWRKNYNHVYKGFFAHLIKNNIVHRGVGWYGWGYVANPSGGFWGLWWNPLSDEAFQVNHLPDVVDEIYLQIEDDQICVKLTMNKKCPKENQYQMKKVTHWLYEQIRIIVPEFQSCRTRLGTHMTAGYIQYDEKNYAEKIRTMENAMQTITKGVTPFELLL